jgi:hypothetical protein
MVRGERLPNALLKEARLHLVPLEREVERYPSMQKEKRTMRNNCSRGMRRASSLVQIPITEIKHVDRQHI